MPRRKPDDAVKQRMWAALLRAAKDYHRQDTDRGMVTRISEDAGVSKAAVSDWKNGGNYPEEATLRKLASLYGVSAEILSGYRDGDVLAVNYGSPDEVLERSVTLTTQIITRLIKNPTFEQSVNVTRRVNSLMVEGRSDEEIKGILFDEIPGDD